MLPMHNLKTLSVFNFVRTDMRNYRLALKPNSFFFFAIFGLKFLNERILTNDQLDNISTKRRSSVVMRTPERRSDGSAEFDEKNF